MCISQARLLAVESPLGRWTAFRFVPLQGLFPHVFGGLLLAPPPLLQQQVRTFLKLALGEDAAK